MFTPYIPLIGCAEREPPKFTRQGWGLWSSYVQRLPSARPIADPIKHHKIQQQLTRQFVRQSNIVRPTSDDIRIAKTNAQTELKRADLEYRKREEERERRLASAWRR